MCWQSGETKLCALDNNFPAFKSILNQYCRMFSAAAAKMLPTFPYLCWNLHEIQFKVINSGHEGSWYSTVVTLCCVSCLLAGLVSSLSLLFGLSLTLMSWRQHFLDSLWTSSRLPLNHHCVCSLFSEDVNAPTQMLLRCCDRTSVYRGGGSLLHMSQL